VYIYIYLLYVDPCVYGREFQEQNKGEIGQYREHTTLLYYDVGYADVRKELAERHKHVGSNKEELADLVVIADSSRWQLWGLR